VQLLHHASVTEIRLNAAGTAVDHLRLATLDGAAFQVRARQYVLACGGLENARLMLVSRSQHAGGVGNAHDVVGRYFMDHPRAVFGRVNVPATCRLRALRGRPLAAGKLQLGIGLSAATQRREGLLNHYVTLEALSSGYAEARYQALVQAAKVLMKRGHAGSRWDLRSMRVRDLQEMVYLLSPKELMPHSLYRLYVAARDALPRKPAPQTYIAVYFCEQPPDPDSRVTLSNEVDRLGMQRLRLDWRIGSAVTDSMRRMHGLLARHLDATGSGTVEPPTDEVSFTDASHHMGTTRMGVDPATSVVDPDCRVHGMANLFVAGSSVFPAAGYANPTITIVALAIRLARHLCAPPQRE
jgi:choline dehydrogenase-like flavoprotein